MAKISHIYNLNKTQFELDFVDIDIDKDLPLFLDPHFISFRKDAWSQSANRIIQSYFEYLSLLLKNKKIDEAKEIFIYLEEPNETCLGLSTGKPQGRTLNSRDIETIFTNLLNSKVVQSGLVQDIQDTMIFVDGVGPDKLSDMVTVLIREKLVEFTIKQCELWEIPLTNSVETGFYWNSAATKWESKRSQHLIIDDRKILLVPKSIVSFKSNYTPDFYHQHFVLNFLKHEHLRLRTSLVKKRVNKKTQVETEYVTKKDLKSEVSSGTKLDLRTFSLKHPEVFKNFKTSKLNKRKEVKNSDLTEDKIEDVCSHLSNSLRKIKTGKEEASKYENIIAGILELLFYPDLVCPEKQVRIHGGKKIIDITFDNAANSGSFLDFHQKHGIPCQYIMVECKNYSKDPANPELDQLIGRFSPNRGKVGLLVFRSTSNLPRLMDRAKETYKDDNGLIIPIADVDLINGLNLRSTGQQRPLDKLLRDRSREIQMG